MLEGFAEAVENIKETVEDIGENIKETVSELTQQKETALAEGDTEYANYYESGIEAELGTHQGEALELDENVTDAEYANYYEADTERAESGTRQEEAINAEDPEYAKYYEETREKQPKGEISFGGRSGIERAKSDIEWAAKHGFEGHLRTAQRKLADEYVKEAKRNAEK